MTRPGGRIAFGMLLALALPARAESPSPLAEWQYSAGRVLERYVTSTVPEWGGMAGLMGESVPRYEGARAYRAFGGPILDFRYRDVAFASNVEGVGVNLWRGKGHRAGFAATYDLGRDEDVDPALAGLGNIRPTMELKAFAEYVLFPVVVRGDVRRALSGHGGWTADLGAYVPVIGKRDFFVLVGQSVTWADWENMRRSFGVDGTQAAQSGYAAYVPSGGIRDTRSGLAANWFITEHWLLHLSGSVEWLLGDAADSPFVQERRQALASGVVAYRW
jgi:outer membrane scaffolding protein for murein synthesis (MipA/OmpV family)